MLPLPHLYPALVCRRHINNVLVPLVTGPPMLFWVQIYILFLVCSQYWEFIRLCTSTNFYINCSPSKIPSHTFPVLVCCVLPNHTQFRSRHSSLSLSPIIPFTDTLLGELEPDFKTRWGRYTSTLTGLQDRTLTYNEASCINVAVDAQAQTKMTRNIFWAFQIGD